MQSFVRGGPVHALIVARCATPLVKGRAVLGGNKVSWPKQERESSQNATEVICHIGMDFITLKADTLAVPY